LVRPFRRTPRADFANASGIPEVLSCIGQIFGTDPGTFPWRVDFGINLQRLRQKNNTPALVELARVMLTQSLQAWTSRATLRGVAAEKPSPNVLVLIVTVLVGGKLVTVRIPV
jgi:phage baseplate assembly protein W